MNYSTRYKLKERPAIGWGALIALGLYFVISIFEGYLNGVFGSLTKYYIFVVMFFLVFKQSFKLKMTHLSWIYIWWLLYKFMSLLWTEDMSTFKLHMISQIGMVVFLVVLLSAQWDYKTMSFLLGVYWCASILMGVLSILFSESYHGVFEARQVLIIAGVEIDPNNLAALMLVGIAISLANVLYEKKHRIVSLIGLVINVYACFSTASRSSFVTMVAGAAFCCFYSTDTKKIGPLLARIGTIGFSILLIYYLAMRFLPEDSFSRVFDLSGYEGGSGRGELWEGAIGLFLRDPFTFFLGAGWGTSVLYNETTTGLHNTFIEMLCDVGLLGTMLFMFPVIVIAIRLLKKKKPTVVLLLGSQFIPSFFIGAINKRFFWNAIFLLFMAYYQSLEE